MSDATLVVLLLGAGTYALKAAGPMLLGGRTLPGWMERLSERAPAALLAALVVVSTVADSGRLTLDARLVGIGVAAAALWLKAPFVVMVIVASSATALARTLG